MEPDGVQLTDLPVGVLAYILQLAALRDASGAAALASSCQLLAAVALDERHVWAPLCAALADAARVEAWLGCGGRRPYAQAYRGLRHSARLCGNLWRSSGDSELFGFYALGSSLQVARLTHEGGLLVARHVCLADADADSTRANAAGFALLALDADRLALSVRQPRRDAPPSAVAAAVAAVCAGERGVPLSSSPPGSFSHSALLHARALVQSRAQRKARQAGVPDDTRFLIRVALLSHAALSLHRATSVLQCGDTVLSLQRVDGLLCATVLAAPAAAPWAARGARVWEADAECAPPTGAQLAALRSDAGDVADALAGVSCGRWRAPGAGDWAPCCVYWFCGGRVALRGSQASALVHMLLFTLPQRPPPPP
jgi:hypothetical protein